MDYLKLGIEFLIVFLIIYLLYYFFTIKKCQKDDKYIPVEVNLILIKYNIDIKKINLYQMIKVVSLITSLIISLSVTIITNISNKIYLSLIIGVSLSLVLAVIIYGFIGSYYKKKEKKNNK